MLFRPRPDGLAVRVLTCYLVIAKITILSRLPPRQPLWIHRIGQQKLGNQTQEIKLCTESFKFITIPIDQFILFRPGDQQVEFPFEILESRFILHGVLELSKRACKYRLKAALSLSDSFLSTLVCLRRAWR